jgi:DNA helicase HerA-like ATPase
MSSLIDFKYSDSIKFIDSLYNHIDPEVKACTIFYVFTALTCILGYILYIFTNAKVDQKRALFRVEISFPKIDSQVEVEYISSMQAFWNSTHDLLQNERVSFEIHKVDEFITLHITTPDKSALKNITKYLTSIKGLTITQTTFDPLGSYTHSYAKRLVLTNNFFSINLEEKNLFSKLIDYLSSLPNDQQGSVLFYLRPVSEKDNKIENLIRKNDLIICQNQRHYTKLEQANFNLSQKLKGKMFLVQIYVIGNKKQTPRSLASIFKIQSGKNKFNTFSLWGIKNAVKLKYRYVCRENIFTSILRSWFGSYLTSHELALMIHPTQIERGIFKSNKSIIMESTPEFLERGDNKLLIGSSYLKTGEKKQVFFPSENLRRHMYILGSTGSGKSTVLIRTALSAAKQQDKAMIFFDPHEQDLNMIVRRLPNLDDVVYFKLDSELSNRKITFNPLFSFQTTDTQKDTLTEDILNIFEQEAKDGDLGTSIKKLLKFLISTGVHFADAYYKYLIDIEQLSTERAVQLVNERQITLPDLPYILRKNSSYRLFLEKVFFNYQGKNISLRWEKEIDEFQLNKSILDGIDNRLSNIITDTIQPIFEGNSFDIKKLIRENKKILIPISETSFGNISKKMITKLLLTQIWSYVQYSYDPKDEKERVQIIIDEMQEAESPLLPRMLSEARKYGASLILAHQFLNQVSTKFLNSVLGNVGSMLVFNMGNYQEVKEIVGMFGGEITAKDISNLSPFHGFLRTIREENKGRALLSFQTMDYRTEFEEIHDDQRVNELIIDTLEKYGEESKNLFEKRKAKLEDAERYFLFSL